MREATAGSSVASLERPGASGDGDEDDISCPDCGGTGTRNGEVCPTCNGSGSVEDMAEADSGTVTCPTCDGAGTIRGGSVECPDCDGTGKVAAESVKESAVARMLERDVSTDERKALAKSGSALPDGSFPIASKADLGNAVQAYGRASDKAAAKAHIVKRAKALGATDELPDDWKGTKEAGGSIEARLAAMESQLAESTAMLRALREATPDHLNQAFESSSRVKNSRGEDGYLVTLIREGPGNAEDGAWYPGSAIRELVESGRAEGMQAYADHPTLEEEDQRPERSVRELIGTHTDVRYMEEGGLPKAKSVFVPITTNEQHPHYGWVTTLAEAAARNQGPQPLVGWSLYGVSAGDEGKRPDGSEGRIATLIMPSSGDMVTNAGAGGEFARRLMMESARRLRRAHTPKQEDTPMQIGAFRTQMAEALKKVREADSDEARTAALEEVAALETEASKIEAASPLPNTVEALTEAAPKLVEQMREAAKAEAKQTVEELQTQLRETQGRLTEASSVIGQFTNIREAAQAIRDGGVTDDVEVQHYLREAKKLDLSRAEDIKAMVEAEVAREDARQKALLDKLAEAQELPDVEGVFFRTPAPPADGGAATLRESGLPLKQPANA